MTDIYQGLYLQRLGQVMQGFTTALYPNLTTRPASVDAGSDGP